MARSLNFAVFRQLQELNAIVGTLQLLEITIDPLWWFWLIGAICYLRFE